MENGKVNNYNGKSKAKYPNKKGVWNCKDKNKGTDVQLSKSLSWVLRHTAPSLGLKLSPDGYVPVDDVLALDHPKFRANPPKNSNHPSPNLVGKMNQHKRKYTVEDVIRVVENNDKQRFRLEYKNLPLDNTKKETPQSLLSNKKSTDGESNGEDSRLSSSNDASGEALYSSNEKAQTRCTTGDVNNEVNENLVLCIRANQGHSFTQNLKSEELLTPMSNEELSDPNFQIIHGTTRKAWEEHISKEGLNRMKRNHIHFATGLPASAYKSNKTDGKINGKNNPPISGMRSSSEIHIYISGDRCAIDSIPFYRSDNGVILTAGVNEKGVLPVKYFDKVVYAFSGKILWKGGDNDSDDKGKKKGHSESA